MSGFEVAGIVLGAFPIALHFLDDYREMAKRAGLWYRIRLEYTKCRNDVEFQRVTLISHLRHLILPLLVDDDTDKANQLLSDPGGESWKEPRIEALLRERLGQTYELYLNYITGMEEIMVELNKELSMDSSPVQEQLANTGQKATATKSTLRTVANKAEFQLYKVKFSNGEAKRKELLGKLQEYNDKLEKLLSTSDRDAQIKKQRTAVQYKTAIDSTLCNFWKQASKLFQALASAWNCTCAKDHHLTKLLLQHRTNANRKAEFDILFSAKGTSGWHIQHTRICEDMVDDHEVAKKDTTLSTTLGNTSTTTPISSRHPAHRQATAALNLKSAMRQKTTIMGATGRQRAVMSQSSVTIGTVQINNACSTPSVPPAPVSLTLNVQPILSLCLSLQQPAPTPTTPMPRRPVCYGYLTATDNDGPQDSSNKFFLHTMWHKQTPSLTVITFDQLMTTTKITRKQRYILALTLASSFLQLLDTPWLPVSWKRSDIVFLVHGQTNPSQSQQIQPYLKRDMSLLPLSSTPGQTQSLASATNIPPFANSSNTPAIEINRSLDNLGILLLELCFGQLLESQDRLFPPSIVPKYKSGLAGGSSLTEEERIIFNMYAARNWLYEVEDEAGEEYFRAVDWCLGNINSRLDRWRADMLRGVVEPLSRCGGWVEGVFP